MKKTVGFLCLLSLFSTIKLAGQSIVFHETFNDNSRHWFTGTGDGFIYTIDSGYYKIASGGIAESNILDSAIQNAFYASFSGKIEMGRVISSYGFYLQSSINNLDRKLVFLLNPSGKYTIFIEKPDGTFPLSKWTESPYIMNGDALNTLSISGDTNTVSFYINDFFVAKYDSPVCNFTHIGIASFDTSNVSFDELFVYSYPQLYRKFNVDFYDFPKVLNYLMEASKNGFEELKGNKLPQENPTMQYYDSKLWLPGVKQVFISNHSYTSIINNYNSAAEAIEALSIAYSKLSLAIPDAKVQEGVDELKLPYYVFARQVNEQAVKPSIDLYISKQTDEKMSETYSVVLEILK